MLWNIYDLTVYQNIRAIVAKFNMIVDSRRIVTQQLGFGSNIHTRLDSVKAVCRARLCNDVNAACPLCQRRHGTTARLVPDTPS